MPTPWLTKNLSGRRLAHKNHSHFWYGLRKFIDSIKPPSTGGRGAKDYHWISFLLYNMTGWRIGYLGNKTLRCSWESQVNFDSNFSSHSSLALKLRNRWAWYRWFGICKMDCLINACASENPPLRPPLRLDRIQKLYGLHETARPARKLTS